VPASAGWISHLPVSSLLWVMKQQGALGSPGPMHQPLPTCPAVGRLKVTGWGTAQGRASASTNKSSVRRLGRQAGSLQGRGVSGKGMSSPQLSHLRVSLSQLGKNWLSGTLRTY